MCSPMVVEFWGGNTHEVFRKVLSFEDFRSIFLRILSQMYKNCYIQCIFTNFEYRISMQQKPSPLSPLRLTIPTPLSWSRCGIPPMTPTRKKLSTSCCQKTSTHWKRRPMISGSYGHCFTLFLLFKGRCRSA